MTVGKRALPGLGQSIVWRQPRNFCVDGPGRGRVRVNSNEGLRPAVLDFRGEEVRRAGVRLHNLVSGVGNGEDELLDAALQEQPAFSRTMLSAAAGGIVILGCSAVCLLCGNDPAGGARLSFESLQAGLVGVIAALPVMSLRRSQWDAQALSNSPVLEEMINRKADDLGPIITGLSRPQLAAVIVTDTVTILELMLVALMGCIDSSLGLYTRIAEKNLGVDIPDLLPFAVALGVSSGLYGLWHFAATTVSEDEATVVMDAVENADRYYQVVGMTEGKSKDPALDSLAFKMVAKTWFSNNQSAATLSGVLAFFDIFFLGVLWRLTGDITAPAVVAILGSAVDYTCAANHKKAGG